MSTGSLDGWQAARVREEDKARPGVLAFYICVYVCIKKAVNYFVLTIIVIVLEKLDVMASNSCLYMRKI